MTHLTRLSALFLVCSAFTAACAAPPAPEEDKGSTTSHETAPSACSETYQGRTDLGSMSLSSDGALTNAFAIPVDPSTTSRVSLTFHVESIAGRPWSELSVRLTTEQGQQLGDVVTSGGGLRIIPLLTSAYPFSHVFYAQVTLTNPTQDVGEQVTLASDVWQREGCNVATETQCSCDGVAVDGSPVHSDVCGSTVCGTDHKLWVCETNNYQPSSDTTDCQ